jgi:hypothetical protein
MELNHQGQFSSACLPFPSIVRAPFSFMLYFSFKTPRINTALIKKKTTKLSKQERTRVFHLTKLCEFFITINDSEMKSWGLGGREPSRGLDGSEHPRYVVFLL